jgi:hypothetical protein
MAHTKQNDDFDRSQIRTRLTPREYERFCRMADKRSISRTQLAREALTWYLNDFDKKLSDEDQGPYARQLRASTNRICALLAKIAIDVRTGLRVLADLQNDTNRFVDYRNASIKQITQALTPQEKSVAHSMFNAVSTEQRPISEDPDH